MRSAEPVASVGLFQISARTDLSRWLDAREAALRLRSRAPREQSRVFQSASDASGEVGLVVRKLGASAVMPPEDRPGSSKPQRREPKNSTKIIENRPEMAKDITPGRPNVDTT